MSLAPESNWRLVDPKNASASEVEEYYDTLSTQFDDVYGSEGSFRFPPWNDLCSELNEVTRFSNELCPVSIIDLGCGTGHWSTRLAHSAESVWLVDVSSRMLVCASTKVRQAWPSISIHIVKHDILRADVSHRLPTTASLAVLGFVLSHYGDNDCYRILKTAISHSGKALLIDSLSTFPLASSEFVVKQHQVNRRWVGVRKRYPTLSSWQRLIRDAGFRIIELSSSNRFFAALIRS